jgi:hypothetical protein
MGEFAEPLEGIEQSAVFMQLFHRSMVDPEADALPLFQLGAAIMMDKPLVVLVLEDREADVPEKLRRFADKLIVVPDLSSPTSRELIARALREVQDGQDS